MTSLFDLQNVTFGYPGRQASVKSATLRIEKGEHLAIIGPNGAGKSTLLHLLGGLLFPTSGCVDFEGVPLTHDLLDHNPAFRRMFRRRVGILFQNSDTQLFCPTVLEEVAFGPMQVFSREEALEKSWNMMRAFCVDHLAEEAPYALSGGEKRRVALASVLVMEPEVFLLDEPMANLDPKSCDFLHDVISQYFSTPGKTIIATTHNLQAAGLFSHTCAVLTPQHTIALHARTADVLNDRDLLLQVNLVSRKSGEQLISPAE